jgi:elongation factor Ts
MTSRTISAQEVKELRERTGAGFMDSKQALVEADGDMDRAAAIIRERGRASAERKAGREAREGLIGSYIHTGGRVGSLIEVNCETDFVARTDEFQRLVRELGMQVAGHGALYPTREAVPPEVLAARRADIEADPDVSAKPEAIRARIVEGRIDKWLREVVLEEQPFRDTDQTVGDHIRDAIGSIGENIRVRRFVRFGVGEDL